VGVLALEEAERGKTAEVTGEPELKFFGAAAEADELTAVAVQFYRAKLFKGVVAVEIEQCALFSRIFQVKCSKAPGVVVEQSCPVGL